MEDPFPHILPQKIQIYNQKDYFYVLMLAVVKYDYIANADINLWKLSLKIMANKIFSDQNKYGILLMCIVIDCVTKIHLQY